MPLRHWKKIEELDSVPADAELVDIQSSVDKTYVTRTDATAKILCTKEEMPGILEAYYLVSSHRDKSGKRKKDVSVHYRFVGEDIVQKFPGFYPLDVEVNVSGELKCMKMYLGRWPTEYLIGVD